MKSRPFVFAILVALFLAFCVWRMAWFPYHAEALYAAIPPHAMFVSEHGALAGRWPLWVGHPLVRSVALALGVPRKTMDDLAGDPGTRAVLDRLAARNTVTAYLPNFGRTGQPAWIVASWVGVQGQFLRWGFYKSFLSDFESRTFSAGRKGWRFIDRQGVLGGQSMSFAVTEGVLLGCLSAEPDGVTALVERVERGVGFPAALQSHPLPGDGVTLDRMLFGELNGDAQEDGVGVWSCTLALQADAQASGTVFSVMPPLAMLGADAGGAVVAGLAHVLRDTPGALMIGPNELLETAGELPAIGPNVRVFWDHLKPLTPPQGRMFVGLAQPAYSGRVMGFKVATLMIGLQLADPAAVEATIGAALDAFNAQFHTTLIRRAIESEGTWVTTLESVRRGPLSGLGDGERPSYAVSGDWLVVSSSGEALTRMLTVPDESDAPRWARELAAERSGAMAWVDLLATAEALIKITAVADLLAIAQGRGRDTGLGRQRLAIVQAWLSEVRAMEYLRLWISTRDGAQEWRFQLGPYSARGTEAGGVAGKDL